MTNENIDWIENHHPGICLKEDFLDALGITPYRLAKSTGLTQSHVAELIKGKRNMTPNSAIKIAAALGMTAEFWLKLQANYDLAEARRKPAAVNLTLLVQPQASPA